MDIREKQHGGQLYLPGDESLQREQLRCLNRLYEFNQIRPSDLKRKTALLKEMFAELGEDCYIEIFKRCNAYIWAPAGNIIRSGFYDTKEKAILSAKDALNGRM